VPSALEALLIVGRVEGAQEALLDEGRGRRRREEAFAQGGELTLGQAYLLLTLAAVAEVKLHLSQIGVVELAIEKGGNQASNVCASGFHDELFLD
jgi:hypothetical protein